MDDFSESLPVDPPLEPPSKRAQPLTGELEGALPVEGASDEVSLGQLDVLRHVGATIEIAEPFVGRQVDRVVYLPLGMRSVVSFLRSLVPIVLGYPDDVRDAIEGDGFVEDVPDVVRVEGTPTHSAPGVVTLTDDIGVLVARAALPALSEDVATATFHVVAALPHQAHVGSLDAHLHTAGLGALAHVVAVDGPHGRVLPHQLLCPFRSLLLHVQLLWHSAKW